ncbi:ecotin family protein [Campylobacter concisus]|uniref:Ecotin n=1 Tax=Campylobacter concisus ATCC 51562 TaxID=1242969 RepID=U2GB26_9BACT|nr:ecotin family protein [Campylobacter concisus]ERJ25284.1 Ecotin precursor [Campylobacter concisus ATCC 51562]
MRKFLLFIAACMLPFALLAGENAPKTEENIFELPISKMPPDYFKYEVAFFKDIEIDCNFAFLLGGKLEEKEDARGIYYEFSGGDELAQTMMLCKDGKKKRRVYYEFTKILPGISPIRIITPKGVSAEIRMYERVKKIEAKKERKSK